MLEMELHEMRAGVKEGEQTGRRLQENCEEYLKIIEKMERSEQKRTTIVETEYQEIERMERIFSQFE